MLVKIISFFLSFLKIVYFNGAQRMALRNKELGAMLPGLYKKAHGKIHIYRALCSQNRRFWFWLLIQFLV